MGLSAHSSGHVATLISNLLVVFGGECALVFVAWFVSTGVCRFGIWAGKLHFTGCWRRLHRGNSCC
jgi:hypothetical protein